jgi:uncharacterized membrane protein
MKYIIPFILTTLLLLSILSPPTCVAQDQQTIVYQLQLNTDNTAKWAITKVQNINGSVDTWENFQQKIIKITDSAANITQRPTAIDLNSLQMTTTIYQPQSKTTEYTFTWLNFTTTQNALTNLGDIFQTPNFFEQLYGEGRLEITYPPSYTIATVNPAAFEQENSSQKMVWLRTQDFVNGKPQITFNNNPTPTPQQTNNETSTTLYLSTAIIAATITAIIIFYLSKKHKKPDNPSQPISNFKTTLLESDEEKILKILISKGNSAPQSTITDQCNFSKAKTSQLLTALERKGVVTRYKRGRDKIVTIAKQVKSDKP